jgi:hypothetical protein
MQRGLAVEEDHVPVLQVPLHHPPDLRLCVHVCTCVCGCAFGCGGGGSGASGLGRPRRPTVVVVSWESFRCVCARVYLLVWVCGGGGCSKV